LEPPKRTFSAPGRSKPFTKNKQTEEDKLDSQKGKQKEVEKEVERKMTRGMISPAARDAPRFSSKRPDELRRFLREMEDLFKEAGIDDDEEKKESIGKYTDQSSEDQWKSLEMFHRGNSWNDFKKELLENYPEAAEAERGTPARIKQICRDARGIELGDLSALLAFRRVFITEAKKLSRAPAAMSNRELVELFIGTLSPAFAREVVQYLGNKAEIGQQSVLPTTAPKKERRPEDRYDLEEVCRAAVQVTENSQGMFHLLNSSEKERYRDKGRKESNFNQYQTETSDLVQKMESLENSQAEEKDKIVLANKNLDNRFNDLENMMKTFIMQSGGSDRKDSVPQYDPQDGVKIGQPGTIPRWGGNGNGRNNEMNGKCYYCGGLGHFIPGCQEMKKDIKNGYVMMTQDGKLRMRDGGYIPSTPDGAPIKERIERQNMRRQNQLYCGYDENGSIPETVMPMYASQFVHTTEDPTQRRSRLERELNLQEKEEQLEIRKLKLEREEKRRVEQTSKPTCSPQVLELLEQLSKEDKTGFQ
jgi:hypothetical protein